MAGAAKPRRKAAAKGYQLAEPVPEGLEVIDTTKKRWVIGSLIGSGGFGTVYLAAELGSKDFDYVIKVEPHGNGPLFVEMHCYQRILKPTQISDWVKKKKLKFLGVSPYHGIGSFEQNNCKYRFMVIQRFGQDLQKLLDDNHGTFPPKTVYLVGLYLIDILEYIHESGYVHGDIKAANLLLGRKKSTENQVYLIDMGLACKYQTDDVHKKEMPDPKKAHNGTPEFTSRDAHRGCFSRRSDMEILCYNLLQWLVGELPWEAHKADCKKLQIEKEKCMKNVDLFLSNLFKNEECPDGVATLVSYVGSLAFDEMPDYSYCRKLLQDELKKLKCGSDHTLEFHKAVKKKAAAAKASKDPPTSDKENAKKKTTEKRKASPLLQPDVIPTPAMLELMNKKSQEVPKKARRVTKKK